MRVYDVIHGDIHLFKNTMHSGLMELLDSNVDDLFILVRNKKMIAIIQRSMHYDQPFPNTNT